VRGEALSAELIVRAHSVVGRKNNQNQGSDIDRFGTSDSNRSLEIIQQRYYSRERRETMYAEGGENYTK
jgi:hypothetical protein